MNFNFINLDVIHSTNFGLKTSYAFFTLQFFNPEIRNLLFSFSIIGLISIFAIIYYYNFLVRKKLSIQLNRKERRIKELEKKLKIIEKSYKLFRQITKDEFISPFKKNRLLLGFIREDIQTKNYENLIPSINIIDESLLNFESILNDINNISFLEYSDKKILKSISLNEIIHQIKENISTKNYDSIITIEHPILPLVFGQKYLYTVLFKNLLVNSIEFSNKKELKIEIEYKIEKDFYVFSIVDYNFKIPKEYHALNFDDSFSLEVAKEHGIGVSLMISKTIINFLQQRIWVEETKKGNVIYFTLPKL